MGRLILIRHSLPEIQPDLPPSKWSLGFEGQRRAGILGEIVATMTPASLHSSAHAKVMETAEFVTSATGLMLNMDPGFNEQERPNEPFTSEDEYLAAVSEALARPDELVYGTETVNAAVDRFSFALEEAERYSQPGDMVVVSHGTVISGYVASRVGIDPAELWRSLGMPGIVCLNWPGPDRIELQQNIE